MADETLIPQLGFLLRKLITAGGYRSYLADQGLIKDLDDVADGSENRQGTIAELLQNIENTCLRELAEDCGNVWAQLFRVFWFCTRTALQTLVQHVDTHSTTKKQGQDLFFQCFTVPMLSGFIRLCHTRCPGPDPACLWNHPFQTWVRFAADLAGINEQTLEENLANQIDVDPRTIQRWLAGEPIAKLNWPMKLKASLPHQQSSDKTFQRYTTKVAAALGEEGTQALEQGTMELLAGWLLVATAFQSLPRPTRDAVGQDFEMRRQTSWSPHDAVSSTGLALLRADTMHTSPNPALDSAALLLSIRSLFENTTLNEQKLREKLNLLNYLNHQPPAASHALYPTLNLWFSARLAALEGNEKMALNYYDEAVDLAWWRAGLIQPPLLEEALIYAFGVDKKTRAKKYWDKAFLLGLNQGPKLQPDLADSRRLNTAFEKIFAPLKPKSRIPSAVSPVIYEHGFSFEPKFLEQPNLRLNLPGGRSTPLMEAIRCGTLNDVKLLIDAGGNPDDVIPESGEGPFTFALRRACDQNAPAILNFLLKQPMSTETVNRPASTLHGDTPLRFAIEMASPRTVARLIELSAEVEQDCGPLPSSLCYALTLLSQSLSYYHPTQTNDGGRTRADGYDAQEGAIFGIDWSTRRRRLQARTNTLFGNQTCTEANPARPADSYRKVIKILMAQGADANRRYHKEPYDIFEWTPTLYAAEIGDLRVFKMLVEHGNDNCGDPDYTLMPVAADKTRLDALWIANNHQRFAIAGYLLKRREMREKKGEE